jgi:Flp pilus assembly protein TadD
MIIATLACAYRSLGAAGERAALRRSTPESRLDVLQSLVDAHPYLDRARRQRGLAWLGLAYNRGRYDPVRLERARKDLQAVVSLRPQWGEAHADLGWIRYYAGEIEEARAEMLLASRLDPTHMGVGLAHAQVLAWSGDTTAAIAELVRLRKVNPGWPRASARDLASTWTQNPALLLGIP